MFRLGVEITGLDETLHALHDALKSAQASGAFGRVIKRGITMLWRYAMSITPIDTGAWRSSHTVEVDGLSGTLFVNPMDVNPRTGVYVEDYASIYEQRGGDYAIYLRTFEEMGPRMSEEAIQELVRNVVR